MTSNNPFVCDSPRQLWKDVIVAKFYEIVTSLKPRLAIAPLKETPTILDLKQRVKTLFEILEENPRALNPLAEQDCEAVERRRQNIILLYDMLSIARHNMIVTPVNKGEAPVYATRINQVLDDYETPNTDDYLQQAEMSTATEPVTLEQLYSHFALIERKGKGNFTLICTRPHSMYNTRVLLAVQKHLGLKNIVEVVLAHASSLNFFDFFSSLLLPFGSEIKKLDLSHCDLKNSQILFAIALACPNLRVLNYVGNVQMGKTLMCTLLKTSNSLRWFDASYVQSSHKKQRLRDVLDSVIAAQLEYGPMLRTLFLSDQLQKKNSLDAWFKYYSC